MKRPRPTGPSFAMLRLAQIAGAGPAVGRVLRRVGPADVAHRAVDHEGPLGVGLALRPSSSASVAWTRAVMRRLRAICAARKRATNASRVGRLVGAGGIVDVELDVALERPVLVEDRRVEPLGHGDRAADVRGQQHDAVGRLQSRAGEVDGVARRRLGDRRVLGLVLVEQRQRAAARPAAEHHLLVAEALLQVGDAGAEVEHALLQDQRGVVAAIARVAVDDVPAGVRPGRSPAAGTSRRRSGG